nr:unnamed protein product [Callosobruchus analis]
MYYTQKSGSASWYVHLKIYEVVTYISGILYYLSATINPILYNIMSIKFREAFKVGKDSFVLYSILGKGRAVASR